MKNENVEMDAETIARYQAIAHQELINMQAQLAAAGGKELEPKNPYLFGASFSIAGIAYIQVSSVTPMEFTNGFKLKFFGEGGGAAFGGGVFAGAGVLDVDPATLVNRDVTFAVAATPGVPAGLGVTFFLNHSPIGYFHGVGISAFIGFGGGAGKFTRP
jgi:hypothetical protein